MTTVWIYVDTRYHVGEPGHLKVFADEEARKGITPDGRVNPEGAVLGHSSPATTRQMCAFSRATVVDFIAGRAREIRRKENPMTNRELAEDRAANHFEREKHLAKLLMQRLGWPAHDYHNPNANAGRETGADVLVVCDRGRTAIQVTEIDTSPVPGRARAAEKKDWRDSGLATYGGWALNDRDELLGQIQRAIAHKVEIAERHSFDEFDDVWLLASAGVPEMGAVVSTLITSLGLDAAALDAVTLDCLARSKYERAYLHCILDVEHALYSWQRGGRWEKEIQQEPAWMTGPSFWDVQKLMR